MHPQKHLIYIVHLYMYASISKRLSIDCIALHSDIEHEFYPIVNVLSIAY
jgi:hypothetical protein